MGWQAGPVNGPVNVPRPVRVVVGGGIAGLAAAYLLAEDPSCDVVLLEASPEPGGKLRGVDVAGVRVDVGAEAMLNRRPEGVDLASALGLEIVHPATAASQIWTRGALRPLPRSLMGVPLDLDAARGVRGAVAGRGGPSARGADAARVGGRGGRLGR